MLIQLDQSSSDQKTLTFFRAGFRPFFLLAGLQAAAMVPVWLLLFLGGTNLAYPAVLWHGHEMVFGFGEAAVAGFLLTAVPNWTGATPVQGGKLMALTALWLAARVAIACAGALPVWVAPAIALAFLPALAACLAGPLIRARKWRNIAFLPILGVLTVAEALVLAEMAGWSETGRRGLFLGIFVLLLMIAIVGGRIIPGFTANGLRSQGIIVQPRSYPWLERAAIVSLAVTGLAWVAAPDSQAAGALALLSAVLNALRLPGWHGVRTARVPLLWVLHLGFAWLPLGLALLGLACFTSAITPQEGLHGLTAGCVGLMTLGVMSRAALGHSGRKLEPAPLTVAAYGLVAAAGLVRVFGVMLDPVGGLWLSGILWSLGFALYVGVYTPVCLKPRADGRPG